MAEPPRGRRPSDPESRPTTPRPVAKQPLTPRIVDELLNDGEPTRASGMPEARGHTVPYAKVSFGATERAAQEPAPAREPAREREPAAREPSVAPDAERTRIWIATHKLPVEPDPRLILAIDPDGPRAASFRVLRHRLAERDDPRVIAVSSPGEGEGKTTCAANLALALGECGRARVLLIEANVRAPSLAALFGFLPPECFAQQLQRHREAPQDPWSVVEVNSPSLHVAAVKPGDDTSGRPLLDGVAFGIAADMLRRAGYDYIVIDTPPVLGSADVNLVEDYADGVLLVARARTTSSRALRRAVEQLSPGRILGVTLLDA